MNKPKANKPLGKTKKALREKVITMPCDCAYGTCNDGLMEVWIRGKKSAVFTRCMLKNAYEQGKKDADKLTDKEVEKINAMEDPAYALIILGAVLGLAAFIVNYTQLAAVVFTSILVLLVLFWVGKYMSRDDDE